MVEIFNTFINIIGDIGSFLLYVLKLPKLLMQWTLSLPPYLSEGMIIVITLVTTIIVIKIFILCKEGVKPW